MSPQQIINLNNYRKQRQISAVSVVCVSHGTPWISGLAQAKIQKLSLKKGLQLYFRHINILRQLREQQSMARLPANDNGKLKRPLPLAGCWYRRTTKYATLAILDTKSPFPSLLPVFQNDLKMTSCSFFYLQHHQNLLLFTQR